MDQAIRTRFDNVLAKADMLRTTVRSTEYGTSANDQLMAEWRSQSLKLLRSLFADDDPYVVGFSEGVDEKSWSAGRSIDRGKGVLRAAHEDFVNGHLWTMRELVHAELFDNFLEMAAHLSETGFRTQAIVTAASTLEEHLRQLAAKHTAAVHRKAAMTNDALYKQGVYSLPEYRQVQGWLALRNDSGGHTTTTERTKEEIGVMIDGIRRFIVEHPA